VNEYNLDLATRIGINIKRIVHLGRNIRRELDVDREIQATNDEGKVNLTVKLEGDEGGYNVKMKAFMFGKPWEKILSQTAC